MIDATIGHEQYTSKACILLPDHDPEVCICQERETLTHRDDTVQKWNAYYNDTRDFKAWKAGVQHFNDVTVENNISRTYFCISPVANVHKEAIENKYICF